MDILLLPFLFLLLIFSCYYDDDYYYFIIIITIIFTIITSNILRPGSWHLRAVVDLDYLGYVVVCYIIGFYWHYGKENGNLYLCGRVVLTVTYWGLVGKKGICYIEIIFLIPC